jgi:sulfate adenylyltransferase subunit 1
MVLKRENVDLLRFSVIGNVDDGKSTLIGRLLYDSKSIFEDQLLAIEESSKRRGEGYLNLALLTDGLKDEREQGITIDVAYRYFTTLKRKFIIADCPGHTQYTRNMVTGTSSAQASIIMIDARNGVVEQTKRHAFICSFMGVKHLIVCVNKMDLVGFSEEVFEKIISEMKEFMSKLSIPEVHFIPISALLGDNIVNKSENILWYGGSTLIYTLENLYLASDDNHIDTRFPVQKVIRPISEEFHDFRGYAGRIESGILKPNDEIVLLPSGFETKVGAIYCGDKKIEEAFYPMSVVVTIDGNFDLSRGDMMVKKNNQPIVTQDVDVLVCWLGDKELDVNATFWMHHTTKEVKSKIKEVIYKMDINTLHKAENDKKVKMNDISRIRIRTASPVFVDKYKNNRRTGCVLLVDEATGATVAAGVIV